MLTQILLILHNFQFQAGFAKIGGDSRSIFAALIPYLHTLLPASVSYAVIPLEINLKYSFFFKLYETVWVIGLWSSRLHTPHSSSSALLPFFLKWARLLHYHNVCMVFAYTCNSDLSLWKMLMFKYQSATWLKCQLSLRHPRVHCCCPAAAIASTTSTVFYYLCGVIFFEYIFINVHACIIASV